MGKVGLVGLVGLVALTLLLSACESKLSGEYTDKLGMTSYKFESGNKAYVSALGIRTEAKYEIEGDQVKIESNGQNIIFTILEDGSLETGFGKLTKK